MSMKKILLGTASIALAAVGALAPTVNGGPQSQSANPQVTAQSNNGQQANNAGQSAPAPSQSIRDVSRRIKYLPSELPDLRYNDGGVPPKLWGQHLQRTGRQLWTKAKSYRA